MCQVFINHWTRPLYTKKQTKNNILKRPQAFLECRQKKTIVCFLLSLKWFFYFWSFLALTKHFVSKNCLFCMTSSPSLLSRFQHNLPVHSLWKEFFFDHFFMLWKIDQYPRNTGQWLRTLSDWHSIRLLRVCQRAKNLMLNQECWGKKTRQEKGNREREGENKNLLRWTLKSWMKRPSSKKFTNER